MGPRSAVPGILLVLVARRSTLACGTGEALLLYFAYDVRIAPDDLLAVAPSATFLFVAHLEDCGLAFCIEGNGWRGGLPTPIPEPGATVWGAAFEIPDVEIDDLDEAERAEGRERASVEVIDRRGRRHRAITHRAAQNPGPELPPSLDYLTRMVAGSRHWDLPAGWIFALGDRIEATRS
jgi:gamma-glutamylcyclotransferase (GGCT)/AIG2-like uncharacterized protein YtfP